jgi:hypothetical protein
MAILQSVVVCPTNGKQHIKMMPAPLNWARNVANIVCTHKRKQLMAPVDATLRRFTYAHPEYDYN